MARLNIENLAEVKPIYTNAMDFITELNGIAEHQFTYSAELKVTLANNYNELLNCSTEEDYRKIATEMDYCLEEAISCSGLGVPVPEDDARFEKKVSALIIEQLSKGIIHKTKTTLLGFVKDLLSGFRK
jgi:hypothetical protein